MTSQERVLLALQRKPADRVPIFEQPWDSTIRRWWSEGLPPDQQPADYFAWDLRIFGGDVSFQLGNRVIEETDGHMISRNSDGVLYKRDKRTSAMQLMDFTITSPEIWSEYRQRLVWDESRVDWARQIPSYQLNRQHGRFCCFMFVTGFTFICDTVGPERVMMAMIESPGWVKEMFMAHAHLCIEIAEAMMSRGMDFDAGWIADDLGYRNGVFFSPAMYRELLMPAHKLICDFFKRRGKRMLMHSDGNVKALIPILIEMGIDCLQPLEVKAGMDVVALKRDFGDRLALFGGIDARAMAESDPRIIEHEIAAKVPLAKQGGGYLFHSDHSIPDNVSFAQYCRVMELAQRYGKF